MNLNTGRERYENNLSQSFSKGNTSTATLSADQLLYDGGATQNRIIAAERLYMSSERQVEEVSEANALELTLAYLDVLRYRKLIELAEDNIQTHADALGKIREKFESGATPQADVLLLEARKSMAEATLESRRLQLESSETQYFNLTGKNPGKLIEPNFPLKNSEAKIEDQDFSQNPSIQVAQANEALAEAQRDETRSKFKPTINASLQSTYRDSTRASNIGEENSAFVSLSYDIFDSGRRRIETEKANQLILKANFDRLNTELNTRRAFRDAANALRISEDRIVRFSKYKSAIEEVVSAYKEQFNLGQRALINVLDVENELFTARTSLAEEKIIRLQSAYKILSTKGELRAYLNPNFKTTK